MTTKVQEVTIKPVYDELLDVVSPMVLSKKSDIYKKDIDYIVDAHYGCCFIRNDAEMGDVYADDYVKSVDLTYVLPLELSAVRDNVMDVVPNDPYEKVLENPESITQEKELTALLFNKTNLEQDFIVETLQFIKKCHGTQQRHSGEPFYTHPMAVAALVLEETKDPNVVIGALLHDVVEDSKVPLSYIKSRFGSSIASIVYGVTHMGATFRKKKLNKEENEKHLQSCKDIRAVQVKMADRLHNLSTIRHRPLEKQIEVAQQTLAFYVPLAESMGITRLSQKVKQICEEILRDEK